MDIKDSYLHGTVGVVKSISVSADKLKYKLADITGTVKEVTLPVATTTANGLMSSNDKNKLDAFNSGSLKNNLVLKIESGITEGTDQYTYNGSETKALNIKSGPGIRFTNSTGSLLIYNSGVRSIATGTTNGTISVNTNGTSKDVAVKGLGSAAYTSSDSYVKWDGTSAAYYNITQKSNNSEGYVRAIFYDKDGNSVFGYGYNASNKQVYITNYTYSKDLYLGNGILTYGGRTVAFTDSNITGNAATADKLKSKVKLWGQDFDGSADVSGNMTGVGIINNILDLSTNSTTAKLNIQSVTASGGVDYSHLFVSSNNSSNAKERPLVLQNGYGNVGIGIANPSQKLEVNGTTKSTSFIGNLDGKYVNALTNYTKATSQSNISHNDSLNVALGKLEYKADTAYNLVKGAYDGDGTIENLTEILKVLEGIKDTDVLNNLMQKYRRLDQSQFYENEVISKFYINRAKEGGGGWSYCPWLVYKADKTSVLSYFGVYGAANSLTYTFIGANAYDSTGNLRIYPNGDVSATSFKTINGKSSQFVKGDGSLDSNAYLTSSGTIDYANKLKYNTQIKTQEDLDGFLESNTFKVASFNSITGSGFTGNDGMVLSIPWTSINYGAQIIIDDNKGGIVKIRQKENTTWSNWHTFVTSNNYTSYLPFLNSTTVHATNTSIIYAPSEGGSKGQLLSSNGSSKPVWQNAADHGIHWEGFTRRATANCTWGHLTTTNSYTPVFWLNYNDAALGFSTANNMLHMQIDGYFYQNEGRYKLTDVTETVTELGTEANQLTWKKNGVTNKITIPAANRLNSKVIKNEVTVTVNNTKWTDIYTFSSEVTGTYAIQIVRSDLVASGIMSFYNGVADSIGDEIPLHVYGNATWRPYLRTYNKKLQISSNDAVDTSRSKVTIKIAQIL